MVLLEQVGKSRNFIDCFHQHWCRDHHACLSGWETRVQSLLGPLLKALK